MTTEIWEYCTEKLEQQYSEKDLNTWIKPLQSEFTDNSLFLLAPNRFVVDWIEQHFLENIRKIVHAFTNDTSTKVVVKIGSRSVPDCSNIEIKTENSIVDNSVDSFVDKKNIPTFGTALNSRFVFEDFVQGKSNEFAFAAASQVAKKPGNAYNPLLIYGGVGLGKTHLMHAAGNMMKQINGPDFRILYLHSERFVVNMIKALQKNNIEQFKGICRSADAFLIDDIQFFAGKDRSQEEFFHIFNALLENHKQIILTSDRYPKEIVSLEERLKSRFGWGLTVAIEPPELETRVAILMRKAEIARVSLTYDVAFFIAKRIRSNVRELEGALKRVIANAEFTGKAITIDFVKEALRDLISLQEKLITIENIQKTVAEYYKIKVADLRSKRRTRSIARPRQMAMALAKELTNRSLPEIGEAFGGRDHTTVLHACRKVKELVESMLDIQEDYHNLLRILSG